MMYSTAILLLATVAVALPHTPVAKRFTNSTLPGYLMINGELIYDQGSLTAAGLSSTNTICNATTDDILVCAKNFRDEIMNDAFSTSKDDVTINLTGGTGGASLKVVYDVLYNDCTVTQPKIITQDSLYECGITSKLP